MYSGFSENTDNKRFDVKSIDDELIFYTYLKYIPKLNKAYKSPFKHENTPSFRFYINSNNELRFKCFSTGYGGDCIELVKLKYGLSGGEAILKIKEDLGYSESKGITVYTEQFVKDVKKQLVDKTETSQSLIEVLTKELTLEDIIYWSTFGITEQDLEYYDVKPCAQVWLNNRLYYQYRKTDPCYRYRISSSYKIYRPTRSGRGKWLTNATTKSIQGFRFLPKKGGLLVITKSYKDIMTFNSIR